MATGKGKSSQLSFKRLSVGQQLLGVVKTVNDFDLVVSLPNHLTGFVTCDRVSEQLSQRIKDISESSSLPNLREHYEVGDMVVCQVAMLEGQKLQRRKRRTRNE